MEKSVKDPRYETISLLIDARRIQSFFDIFTYIPKTIVYKDLGANFNRFDKAIIDPSLFKLRELMTMGELFNMDPKRIIDLAYEQALTLKNSKAKFSLSKQLIASSP